MDSELVIKSEATEKMSNYLVHFDKLKQNIISFQTLGHQNYSVAGFEIRLKRRSDAILINTYLPCMMLLLISFIGFFIPVDMIPGRMALLVTIFLMLVNISSTEKTNGPNVFDTEQNQSGISYTNLF